MAGVPLARTGSLGRGYGMLVCSANWLLPDGSLSRPVAGAELTTFLRDIAALAGRAGFRRDGSYRPIARVDLVFAGDMLDLLSSDRWTEDVRPWDGTRVSAEIMATIAADCLRRGRRAIAALRGLQHRGLSVPVATPRRRPCERHRCRVPVRVVVVTGDRDERGFASAGVPAAMPNLPWPPAVATRWGDDVDVLVSHGHEFDPATCCDAAAARPPSVSESLAIGLIGRFVRCLRPSAHFPWAELLARDTARCHPLELLSVVAARITRQEASARHMTILRANWKQSIRAWHRDARRAPPRVREGQGDVTDCLAGWLDGWRPGDAPPAPPPHLQRALAFDRVAARAHAIRGAAQITLLGHLPAEHTPASPPATQAPVVLGLGGAGGNSAAEFATAGLPWAAVFEQGEYGGVAHTSSWSVAHAAASGYAPLIVGGHGGGNVVDVLQAA
jgi:hypothetical protein